MPSELHGGRLAGWTEDVFTISGAGPYTLSKQIKGEVMMAYLDGRRRPLSEFTVDASADPSTVALGGSLTSSDYEELVFAYFGE